MKLLSLVGDGTGRRKVEMMSDSAVIKDGRPFYVPAIARQWDYRIGVAFHIGRMGKNVAERFARRYIDSMALCVMPRPRDISDEMVAGGDMLHSFDGAVILGSWIDIPAGGIQDVMADGRTVTFERDPLDTICPMVSLMSVFGTLKTGDIMIPESMYMGADYPEDYVVRASFNGVECLEFKVK